MTEKLPNWNLGDFYSSIKDEGINLDLEKYRNFSKSFKKKLILNPFRLIKKIIAPNNLISVVRKGDKLL